MYKFVFCLYCILWSVNAYSQSHPEKIVGNVRVNSNNILYYKRAFAFADCSDKRIWKVVKTWLATTYRYPEKVVVYEDKENLILSLKTVQTHVFNGSSYDFFPTLLLVVDKEKITLTFFDFQWQLNEESLKYYSQKLSLSDLYPINNTDKSNFESYSVENGKIIPKDIYFETIKSINTDCTDYADAFEAYIRSTLSN